MMRAKSSAQTVAAALMFALLCGCAKKGSSGKTETVSLDELVALRKSIGVIDTHVHVDPDGIERLDALLDEEGISEIANLSGGSVGRGLEEQMAAAKKSKHKIHVFAVLNFRVAHNGPGYGAALADQLLQAAQLGAEGLKIPKALGIFYRDNRGRLIAVDDPELDPLFEMAGKLGLPVAIHTADPKAFWLPVTIANERYDELAAHPQWSFYGQDVPPYQKLIDQLERRIARHPQTTIIAVHFGGQPENPERVAAWLEKYPNLMIDTAARIPEIGRNDSAHNSAMMHDLFVKYADRILFATDLGVGREPDSMMYGSTGASPPTESDRRRFFDSTWRYFETKDTNFDHPTPIQGKWKINGVGLPAAVLRKIYRENGLRVLGMRAKVLAEGGPNNVAPNADATQPAQ